MAIVYPYLIFLSMFCLLRLLKVKISLSAYCFYPVAYFDYSFINIL